MSLTIYGIEVEKINREEGFPVVIVPSFHCPYCSRRLQLDLDNLKDGEIRVRGCCGSDHWYVIDIMKGEGPNIVSIIKRDWST
jgi:hypothetical protein